MNRISNQTNPCLKVLSDRVCIQLRSQDSANGMTVITVDAPAGSQVGPHIHLAEEESYYLLEGSLTVQVGDRTFIARAGDFVHIPAGTVHSYHNDTLQPARFLAWAIGGNLDQFFVELSQQVQSIPEDLGKIPEITQRYGIQVVGLPCAS